MGKKEDKEKIEHDLNLRAALKWQCMIRNKKEREELQKDGRGFELESKLYTALYQRSIQIGFFKRKKGWKYLGDEASVWKALCGIAERPEVSKKIVSINAVDWKEKSIILKIFLNRKKDLIKYDFATLLDLLDKEAQFQKKKFGRPKFHLGKLGKGLQIYDDHQIKKKSWKQIGLELLKDEKDDGKNLKQHLEQAAGRARKSYLRAKAIIDKEYKKL